jgi:hypothetical protein
MNGMVAHIYPRLLAVIDPAELAQAAKPGRGTMSSLGVVLLAALVVALGVILWAVFVRQRPGRRERGTLQDAPEPSEPEERGSRRRRRRREHRGRNPTLSEIGGLPPRREGPPSPPTS